MSKESYSDKVLGTRPTPRLSGFAWDEIRHRILKRDRVCQNEGCDSTEQLEVDHVVPLALGGTNRDDNLVARCSKCHSAKTSQDVHKIAKVRRYQRYMRRGK